MSVTLLDLAKRFVDGTPLDSAELAYGRDAGIFGTHGPAGTWTLTEFGHAVLGAGEDWIKLVNGQDNVRQATLNGTFGKLGSESLYYKNRERNEVGNGLRIGALREVDPLGKDQHETGAKLDAGKPRLGLVLGAFANALVEVGKVGTYGAQKYTDNGWLDVPNGKARYTDALLRHVLAETNETHDPDTHLLHAAHAAWNALARLELVLRKRGETE
jgi:hypothetical protein